MKLLAIKDRKLIPIKLTQQEEKNLKVSSLHEEKIMERKHLIPLLAESIHEIDPDLTVLCSEYRVWRGNGRKIDILAINKDPNLVIIEVKRGKDYNLMEVQALRYVALTSKMTYSQAVKTHLRYLNDNKADEIEQKSIQNLLNSDCSDPSKFNLKPKITLIAEDFTKELLTSVIWLNQSKVFDIRCIKLSVYKRNNAEVLLSLNELVLDPNSTEYDVSFI